MTATQPDPTLPSATAARTPTERLFGAALVVGPLVYLAADSTYAARGWDDGAAGVLHVLGAVAYGFVVLHVAAWLPSASRLRAGLLLAGVIGLAGNVAYGFDSIHTSYGDVALVDRSGAATLIKPLGLFFPLSLALVAWAVARLGHRVQAVLVGAAAVAWPVAHIGNVAWLAVLVNVALVAGLGSLAGPLNAGRATVA